MNKKSAMSAMGYAIIFVIILGVVMIISAPMMADKYKNDNNENNTQKAFFDAEYEVRRVEENLTQRIEALENSRGGRTSSNTSNKYICTMAKNPSDYGELQQIDGGADPKKFVFICEYRN